MKISTRLPDSSVNVPKNSHAVEFLFLVLAVGGSLGILYWISGLAVDVIAQRIPQRWEQQLFRTIDLSAGLDLQPSHPRLGEVKSILARLAAHRPDLELTLTAVVVNEKAPNAFAIPGGTVAVTTGLLDTVGSDRELAMVLGHEIGHFTHRHHLKSLGRKLLLVVAGSFIGVDPDSSQVVNLALGASELGYSRAQEQDADDVGLELLVTSYGSAEGATDFFDRLAETELAIPGLQYAHTHPYSANRSKRLRKIIQKRFAAAAVPTLR